MISRYSEILHYSKAINHELESLGHVQKIYSTSYYVSFQVRVRGKSIFILLGRGGGHEGVFLSSANPKSELRKRDKWLEWLRKYVSGSLLLEIEIDPEDRSVALIVQKGGTQEKVYFAWIGRMSYFFHEIQGKVAFKSWSRNVGDEGGFKVFNEVGRRPIGLHQEVRQISGDDLLRDEEKQSGSDSEASKKTKKRMLKITKIKQDLEKLSRWKELKQWLDKIDVGELSEKQEVRFQSLKIKLNRSMSPFQKKDFLYQKMKALREAEKMQELRLQAEENFDVQKIAINNLKTISPVWANLEIKTQNITTEDQYKIYPCDGYSIGVGSSAEGNDRMRKQWSSPDDVWVHAANGKSAHAIIKLKSGVLFNIEMLQKAGEYILNQSGKDSGVIEIVYTHVKYLKSVSGSPGMVIFKKEKRINIVVSGIKHE